MGDDDGKWTKIIALIQWMKYHLLTPASVGQAPHQSEPAGADILQTPQRLGSQKPCAVVCMHEDEDTS